MKLTKLCLYVALSLVINTSAHAAYEEKLASTTQDSQVPPVDILEGAAHTLPSAPVVGNNLPDSTVNTLEDKGTTTIAGIQQIGKGIGTRVNSKGNMPLRHAVSLLLPRGWSSDVADDIARTKVAWGKHENWVILLGQICCKVNAEAIVNWEVRSVSIRSSSGVPAPLLAKNAGPSSDVAMVKTSARLDARPVAVPMVKGPVTTGPLPPHTVRASATATQVAKRNNIPVATFCRWNGVSPRQMLPTGYRVHLRQPAHTPTPEFIPIVQSAPSPPPQNTAPIVSAPATIPNLQPLPQPVPAVQQEILPSSNQDVPTSAPTWLITPGNLQAQVSAWAARANYQLIWKTQNDFEMETQASFQGDFLDAIRQLFMGLQRSGHALRVTLYQGNNVLEVSEE